MRRRRSHGLSCIEAANAEEEALAIAIALREALSRARQDRRAGHARPRSSPAGCWRRWRAGTSRSTIPAATSSPTRRPVCLPASARRPPSRDWRRSACWRCSSIRLTRLAAPGRRASPRHRGARARDPARTAAAARQRRPGARARGLARASSASSRRGERSDLHRSDPRADLTEDDFDAAADLIGRLAAALAPLETLGRGPHAFGVDRGAPPRDHRGAVATTMPARRRGSRELTAARSAKCSMRSRPALPDADLSVALADYPDLFGAAIADRVVRRPGLPGVRVRILGPLEARLTSSDRLVLGGLNEGTWPPEARSDAWLSRPMRLELGLDLPERRIGLSAHDFAQMLGAREVILTRAAKLAGAPTVASRFVQRLAAVAGPRWQTALQHGEKYLALGARARPAECAAAIDAAAGPAAAGRGAPGQAFGHRDRALAARSLHDLCQAHPAAVPARSDRHGAGRRRPRHRDPRRHRGFHPGLCQSPARRTRSNNCWRSAASTSRRWRSFRKRAPSGGRAMSGSRAGSRIGKPRRRPQLEAVQAEIRGEIEIPLGGRSFHLSTRADRIERLGGGAYAILDYKTGQVPTARQVAAGLSPQLTLEGAILRAGQFADIPPGASIAALDLRVAARRRSGRRGKVARVQDLDARPAGRPRVAEARRGGAPVRGPGHALPVARAADVPGPQPMATTTIWRG